MKKRKFQQNNAAAPLDPTVQAVVNAIHETDADPLGSYTGTDQTDPFAPPTQDADDL